MCLTSKVDQLQAENEKLSNDVSYSTNKLDTECLARQRAEVKINELETQLSAARLTEDNLLRENRHLFGRVKQLKTRMRHTDKEIKKVSSALCRLDPGQTRICGREV